MRMRNWLWAGFVGLLIGGCAGPQTGPTPETKAAVAPTGKLRVGFISASIYVTKDPATGQLKGVAIDLGSELARRVGAEFQPVVFATAPAVIAGAKAGEVDVALMGINAERAMALDFSAPYMEVELGFLVRADVPISSIAEVDKAGIRIGVLEKGGSDLHLSRTLKNAVLVRAATVQELYSLFASGKAEVISATKTALYVEAEKQKGSRVLEGRYTVEPIGMGVPKGRAMAATAYVGKFVEDAKAEGLVKGAIDRAGLRGITVAPLK